MLDGMSTFDKAIFILGLILGVFALVVAIMAYMKKKDRRDPDDME